MNRTDVTPWNDGAVFGPPVQIAYVVDDPRAEAARWEDTYGAGPFVVREHIPVDHVVHRGHPSSFDHTSAYGWWGTVMIELFCQHDDSPSAVTERFAPGGTGLHHVACFVDDLPTALASAGDAGLTTAMTARAGATEFAFVDDVERRGHYWELYEASPALRTFYAHVEELHRSR